MTSPSTRSLLEVLAKPRLAALGREFGVAVSMDESKEAQLTSLTDLRDVRFRRVIGWMAREELRAACRAHNLPDTGRSRTELAARLLQAHGELDSMPPLPLFSPSTAPRYAPRCGDIVQVRHRQWLVEAVSPPQAEGQHTKVSLVCLDDDNQGRRTDVLWELELGARVLALETQLGEIKGLDAPRRFGAYLHALKWSSVTATDARLFQSPFRAGIKLFNHQLTPLKKALSLPRANLFIADDVGLGKTIEAGLVLSELMLRQRVDFVLIVCPASVSLQWRDEMQKRFGLRFELYNRAFIARRRQERGFAVNPWSTHTRFIISYPTLRRPEYRDPLLQHLASMSSGDRARKSLLILDEAHTAAPATATKYAVDSQITRVVRDVAPRFENRLFLSATPHNGHSNSFSALLEILDPQRFTRGVPVTTTKALEPVMVRRLKSDLRAVDGVEFPERKVVEVALENNDRRWTARWGGDAIDIGEGDPTEIELSRLLGEYTALMKPERGRGKLVFINLQKRLLSSIEAFHRTLQLHAKSVASKAAPISRPTTDDDEYGADDDTLELELDVEVASSSSALATPTARAHDLLERMLRLSGEYRTVPDAKVLALVDWMRRNLCPALRIGGASGKGKDRDWTDRRVLVFTEYGDTKRYLAQILAVAADGTTDGDERVMQFHGGMSDEQRDEIQRAFNSPPDDHPVRVLIATDAAREGVNLQGHCADLFHFDVPWNPARMEQRNGRIDRTLQPEKEVRCHYFVYPERKEDVVLERLVRKVDVIQNELGSLGAVLMDRLADVMDRGIDDATADALEHASDAGTFRETVSAELEVERKDNERIRAEVDEAGRILNESRRVMEFDPALLRDAIDVGLELAGSGSLSPLPRQREGKGEGTPRAAQQKPADEKPRARDVPEAFNLPPLPESWQPTLDYLRPPRERDESFWDWRKRDPMPVVFRAPAKMNDALVHLHLQHPFVQRILSRFLAQGYSSHDLSRVTVLRNAHDSLVRVIAFGRLSLFGPGATRLHDQLVSVAAQWLESKGDAHLKPFADRADRRAVDMLEQILTESPDLDLIPAKVRDRLRAGAATDFAALWPHVRSEAESRAHDAIQKLDARGAQESEDLRTILTTQRNAIVATIDRSAQLMLEFTEAEAAERDQLHQDRKHMEDRLVAIQRELEREPKEIAALYKVVVRRLQPVGLVYLWPETRA